MSETGAAHRLAFRSCGGAFHLVLATPADLRAAADLDAALWVATAAPVEAFRADPGLLRALDTDGDGRIRVGEFKAAIRWLFGRLRDTRGIAEGATALDPATLNTEDAEGRALADTLARVRAARRGGDPGPVVSLEEIRAVIRTIEARPTGSLGVVALDAAPNPEIRGFMEAVLAVTGGSDAGGGRRGVGAQDLDTFASAARRHLDWQARGALPEGADRSDTLPLGAATAAAVQRLERIRAKIDEYFTLCDAVALGEVLRCDVWPARLDAPPTVLAGLEGVAELLDRSPVAPPRADAVLDFDGPLNPAYADAVRALRNEAVGPLLGAGEAVPHLARADWQRVQAALHPFIAWQASVDGAEAAPLGVERLRACLDPALAAAVRALIEESRSSGIALDSVRAAERLALLQGGLLDLARNFVSFPELYAPDRRALFEEGTLIMDGRRFNLAVKVADRAEHARLTEKGTMFVLYVGLEHKPTGRTREVAVPVTAGAQGLLEVGKRGVFEDVEGEQWLARVAHLVDRPVSLREAVTDPFVRLGRAVTARIESITAAAERQMEQAGGDAVGAVHGIAPAPGAPPAAPPPAAAPPAQPAGGANLGGTLAGGGIAIAALGGSLAFITRSLAGLRWYQILAGLGGAVGAVIVPTVIIAIIRLRSRDLSMLLEGSGWAINARMRLSRRQRRHFTQRPPHPRGSRFLGGARARFWWLLALTVLLVAGRGGCALWAR